MAQQRKQNDQAFGSDAFLDVIANMVGILIILIVIAGLKVSRAPVFTRSVETPVAVETDQPNILIEPAPVLGDLGSPAAWPSAYLPVEPDFVPEPEPIPPPPPEIGPPLELVEQSRTLTQTVSDLQRRIADAERQYAALSEQHQSVHSDVWALEASLAERQGALAHETTQLEEMRSALLATEQQLAELQAALEAASQTDPDIEVLEHRLTPIARLVTQREVHFRLAEGRVSYVPVEELAALVQLDVQRQRDLLLKLRYYQGSVGPEEGYRMQYVVQQQDMSLLDELRTGGNVIRIGVTQWLLTPEPGLQGETPETAVQEGSRFLRILRLHPGATLTFWVYPDSFEAHQQLNAFVREAGFEVAARPLPAGVPIAGSPNGARSLAQ